MCGASKAAHRMSSDLVTKFLHRWEPHVVSRVAASWRYGTESRIEHWYGLVNQFAVPQFAHLCINGLPRRPKDRRGGSFYSGPLAIGLSVHRGTMGQMSDRIAAIPILHVRQATGGDSD